MAGKNTAAFGIYPSYASVESAVESLRDAGFRNTDVSILFPENVGSKDLALVKSSKAPESAVMGAILGAVMGGALGWLFAAGVISIPNWERFASGGPIVTMLAGLGVGSIVGLMIGALIGLEVPEYEAKRFEGRVKKGGILLSIHCDDGAWTKRAKGLLKRTGAESISTTAEARADFAKSDKPLPRSLAGGAI